MTPEAHLITWLEPLWQLYPAQGVIVVGAGNGSSPWIAALQRWNAPNVTLVEADDVQFQHLQHQLSSQDGWQLRKQVIAAETGSVTFHHASNPAEGGLVEPETLRPLWPNLKTRQTSTRQAISLAELLAEIEPTANWMLLDCLPAGALLAGAGNALASCDVIVTRALLPEAGTDLPTAQADAGTITQLLQAHGFCTVATQTSRHPGVAHMLHVRDRTAQLAQLNAELEEEREALQQARQDSLRATKVAQATLAEHAAHNQALQHEMAAMQEQLTQTTQAQATAKQALEYRDAKLKALQAELLQAKQSVQQAAENAEQMQQQLTALQAETGQWREAAEQAREDAAQATASAKQAKTEAAQAVAEREGLLNSFLAELQALKSSVNTASAAPAAVQETLLGALQDIQTSVSSGLNGLQNSLQAAIQAATPDMGELKTLLVTQQASLQGVGQQISQLDLAATLGTALDTQLSKQLAGGKESLKEVETRLRNDLNKGLANAVKQVEAFMRIQNYLGTGDALGDFHGWPISPDIGLFLLEKMREQHYDLIIEFGSGTSTALFAKGVEVISKQKAPARGKARGDTTTSLPTTEIVSFEHDAVYHAKTTQMLKARGLDHRVRLVHAPLVDWREGDQSYLYYDCQDTLAELAQQNAHRQLRILLLVDGPPGATCANARYPAVPFVFSALGRHQIDVVLDDSNRPEEKKIIELWRAFWGKRSIKLKGVFVSSEKGIYYASNNII